MSALQSARPNARLLLVDDHALFRTGLRLIVQDHPSVSDCPTFEVVEKANFDKGHTDRGPDLPPATTVILRYNNEPSFANRHKALTCPRDTQHDRLSCHGACD